MKKSMKNLNCEMFEFTIRFDESRFNKEEFKKTSNCEDEAHSIFVSHYFNKGKKKTDHAHLEVRLDEQNSRFEATFHEGAFETELDIADIPMEEAVKKFSDFLEDKDFPAVITTIFRFDDTFEPLVQLGYPLGYPLIVGNKFLQTGVVSGHEIEFPDDSTVRRIFIAKREETLIVIINAISAYNLTSFNIYSEIQRFAKYTQKLAEKKGDGNAKNDQKNS